MQNGPTDSATTPYIITYSGRRFHFTAPSPSDFLLEDISHGLAHINRFSGQRILPMNVAAHSIIVCDMLAKAAPDEPLLHLAGLLHDAAEAYLGDIVQPVKIALRQGGDVSVYDTWERGAMMALAERMGMDPALFFHPLLRQADRDALFDELSAHYAGLDEAEEESLREQEEAGVVRVTNGPRAVGPGSWGFSVPAWKSLEACHVATYRVEMSSPHHALVCWILKLEAVCRALLASADPFAAAVGSTVKAMLSEAAERCPFYDPEGMNRVRALYTTPVLILPYVKQAVVEVSDTALAVLVKRLQPGVPGAHYASSSVKLLSQTFGPLFGSIAAEVSLDQIDEGVDRAVLEADPARALMESNDRKREEVDARDETAAGDRATRRTKAAEAAGMAALAALDAIRTAGTAKH